MKYMLFFLNKMDYLKVLSFLFMVSASCGFWITDFEISTSNLRNSCPVSDQLPSFLQNQQPGHQEFERVVVFVYRAIGTNQLTTFIPSSHYQKCIPNYPETPGDKIYNGNAITIEKLLQGVDNKPIPIPEDNIPQQNIPEVPFLNNIWNNFLYDPNTVPMDNDQHNVNIKIPLPIRPGIPGLHISGTTDHENWNNRNPDGNAYSLPITFPKHWSNQEQVISSEILNLVPNWEQIVSTGAVQFPKDVPDGGKIIFPSQAISTETELPSSQQSIRITPNLEQHIIAPQSKIDNWGPEYSEDIPKPGHFDPLHEKYVIPPGLHQNVKIPRPSYGEGYLVPPNSWSQLVPDHQPPENLVSLWQSVKVPDRNPVNNQFNSYSWAMNSKFNQTTSPKDPLQKGTFKFPITGAKKPKPSGYGSKFDSWLMTELRVIKLSGQGMSSGAADLGFVTRKIQEALRYHGYTITRNGLLVDDKGVTSSLSNLKLRPLLIGNSFEYNNLLNDYQDGKYKRPVTPMVEGILLSLINPPKILGILTLGLTWEGNGKVNGRRHWRVPQVPNLNTTTRASLSRLMLNVLGGIGGLSNFDGASNNGTGPPLHITPDIINRIIGGSSATGTGTLIASKGRK